MNKIKVYQYKCIKRRIILLNHISILRRIWLNFMALFGSSALLQISHFVGFPTIPNWASLKRLYQSKCASGASQLVSYQFDITDYTRWRLRHILTWIYCKLFILSYVWKLNIYWLKKDKHMALVSKLFHLRCLT
jgi:hypothetical protein